MINPFNFDRPRFARLRYTDVVINDEAYFLVSWELERGYKLRIKSLNYRSYQRIGSAYIAIPADVNHLELVISNLWHSAIQEITLLRELIPGQIDFFPVKLFEELMARSVYAPQVKLVLKTPQPGGVVNRLQVPIFAIRTKNLTKI